MTFYVRSYFLSLLLLNACTEAADKQGAATDTLAGSGVHGHAPATTGVLSGEPFVLAGCYEMTMKRDTATLSLQVTDTVVSGRLRYDWNEKDGNVGTIQGVLRDSLIIAHYTFESEGLISMREVIFKIEDQTLLQGFGELEDRNGAYVFSNPAQVQYMKSTPFIKVDCPEEE
jgi:hypothetical protein